MNLVLLLLHLTSTVQGILQGETTPAVDETEEEDNFTLRWDNPTQTNMSLTSVICYFLLNPPKVLYNMVNGAQIPESQDGQFSGRVQLERDALREGRLRLHLSSHHVTLNTSTPGPIVAPDKKQFFKAVLSVPIIVLLWVLWTVFQINTWKKMKRSTENADTLVDMNINNSGDMNFMINHSADCPPATSAPDVHIHLIV